ncbi:MAG: hypothetical protein IRZ29_02895 [Thermoflavifilum sp.]|nr:hypothetical protein [Thermoflavifilum sp.]
MAGRKMLIQYTPTEKGEMVKLSVKDWEKAKKELEKYKQMWKLHTTLFRALNEVNVLKNQQTHKQSLTAFLDAL